MVVKTDRKVRVLVVDDELGMRDLLSYELESRGFQVITASNGLKALAAVKSEKIELVITDVNMAEMDGVTTLVEIKKINPDLEVIITTGYGTIEMAVDAMKKGAYDFVQKPYNLDEMSLIINRALEKKDLKKLIALYESSKAIFTTVKLKDVCEIIIHLVKRVLNVDECSLMLLDSNKTLSIAASRGISEEIVRETHLKLGERVAGRVAEEQRGRLLIDGLENYPDLSQYGSNSKIGSSIICPLVLQGQTVGVLNLNRKKGKDIFSNSDLNCAEIFAVQVAQAIKNAQIYEKLQNNIEELKAAYRILEETQDRLIQTEKLASIGRLVAGVAHEINNPLTSIIGYSQLLMEDTSGASQHEQLGIVYSEAQRCGRIVQDLLTFARRRKPKFETENLCTLIDSTIKVLSSRVDLKNVTITKDYPECCPEIKVDGSQMSQVLLNLLTNAYHALEHRDKNKEICISVFEKEGSIYIEIKDNGLGISEANMSKIFDPFFTTKEVGHGTGLGLSLSYGIIEEHDGRLQVNSVEGKGATFSIKLPVERSSSALVSPSTPTTFTYDKTNIEGINKILIVEDDKAILNLVESMLSKIDGKVFKSLDVAAGIEIIKANEIDLIISDYRLPKQSGIDLYTEIKKIKPEMANRFLLITGSIMRDQLSLFLKTSAVPYLQKPFSRDELLKTIQENFGKLVP